MDLDGALLVSMRDPWSFTYRHTLTIEDHDPHELTRRLGIEPTEVNEPGEDFRWVLRSEEDTELVGEEEDHYSESMIEFLRPVHAALAELRSLPAPVRVRMETYYETNHLSPTVSIPLDAMRMLADLGADHWFEVVLTWEYLISEYYELFKRVDGGQPSPLSGDLEEASKADFSEALIIDSTEPPTFTYYHTFAIYGHDPDAITSLLGIQPTSVDKPGEVLWERWKERGLKNTLRWSWTSSERKDVPLAEYSECYGREIIELLEPFHAMRDKLNSLPQEASITVSSYYESTRRPLRPGLPARAIQMLADLNADYWFGPETRDKVSLHPDYIIRERESLED